LSLSSQKYGYGIRDPEKTYPGSRGQKGTGSRIRIRNTASDGFCADFCRLVPTELAEQQNGGEEEEDYTRVQELQQQLLNDLPSSLKEQLKTGGLPIILRPLDSSAAPISLIIKQTPRS
jgi:hypothetical protein